MNRFTHRGLALCLVLGLGGSLVACGAKNKDESSKKDDDSDKKDKKKDKGDDDGDKKSSKKHKKDKDKVDIKALLDDGGKEAEGMLKVKLPDDSKDVPTIGGDAPKPEKADKDDSDSADKPAPDETQPAAPAVETGTWFEMGDVRVPQLDWTKKDTPPVVLLGSQDQHAFLILVPFATEEEAEKRLKGALDGMQAKELKWSAEPKQVKIGHDQLAAFIGTGHAKVGSTGAPAKLLFAEIKTGRPLNLLVIGIADEASPEADLNAGEQIITTIKLK